MKLSKSEIEKMLVSYEPLMRKLSNEYLHCSSSPALELDDFMQEARIGLVNAVDAYDSAKGTAFSSFVERGIRICLRKLLSEQSRLIRFPKHRIEQLSALDKAEKAAMSDSDDLLASYSGLGIDKVRMLKRLRKASSSLSLDDALDERSYLEFVKCDDFSSAELDRLMVKMMEMRIDEMKEDDAFILKSISGTFGFEKKSRLSLSKEMNRSYSSITRSYRKSLDSLRKAL